MDSVNKVIGRIRDAVCSTDQSAGVVDLAAPFGWTDSPALCAVFGRAISYLVGCESPASMYTSCTENERFFSYEWVDDHLTFQIDAPPQRCASARLLAVLGPTSINEEKFTTWSTTTTALGLEWDTKIGAVSIPTTKIAKALSRVQQMTQKRWVTKRELEYLLGSLRNVAMCLHAARPFYQHLNLLTCGTPAMDVLQSRARCAMTFSGLFIFFNWGVPTLTMVCILHPGLKVYIVTIFDTDEHKLMAAKDGEPNFDINVSEHFSVALAATLLAPIWVSMFSPQLRCWTDNQMSMARTTKLDGCNVFAPNLNRFVDLAEARHQFRISAAYLPGTQNRLADTRSRLHELSPKAIFTNGLVGRSFRVSNRLRYIYKDFSIHYNPYQWPRVHDQHTTGRGINGARGVQTSVNNFSCLIPKLNIYTNSLNSQTSVGSVPSVTHPTQRRWCCPRLVISLGIFTGSTTTESTSNPTMSSLCAGCPTQEITSQSSVSQAFGASKTVSPSRDPATVSSGGATVLGFFFLLRRSEYVAVDGKLSAFATQCRDVSFTHKNGAPYRKKQAVSNVILRIRDSKTDQLRELATISLHRSGSKWLCPVREAWALVKECRQADFPIDNPLCKVRDGSYISAAQVSDQLKEAASRAGYDGNNYGTHSPRSGGATALFTGGNSETTVKLHGRWKRDCYQRYIHIVNLKQSKQEAYYVRKATMRCGLYLNIDVDLLKRLLFPHPQEIIKKYPEFADKNE
ncbi:Hypothetical protein PHPALM_472 [Phytophthora palmivora]|uniref:Tyr recombinase domain-containing protein n=1 Tax=Phytophthora palmivora TaxID=4796 RepID=A0A2P4YUQ9_9STRA|nr:Hypothetical protein PHPALM_472 [Phytophthora palmivora]